MKDKLDEELNFASDIMTIKEFKRLVKRMEREAIAAGVPPAHVDGLTVRDGFYRPLKKIQFRVASREDEIRRVNNKTYLFNNERRELLAAMDEERRYDDHVAVVSLINNSYTDAMLNLINDSKKHD